MQIELIESIKRQKILPIIGKGSTIEITDKFNKLVSDNFKIIEITLRSDVAFKTAIQLKKQHPDIKIGLGSIKSLSVFEEVAKSKFDFYISPGLNHKFLEFSNNNNINFLPGVSTPSEILTAIEYNFKFLKYFHAENNGGPKSLKFLDEIFNDIKFIPTGGINRENMNTYFELNNVIAIGSSSI